MQRSARTTIGNKRFLTQTFTTLYAGSLLMRLGEIAGGSFGSLINALLSGEDDGEIEKALEQASIENVGIERAFTGFFKRANHRGFDVIVRDILSNTYALSEGKNGQTVKVKADPNMLDLFDLMALLKWVLLENYSDFFMKSAGALLDKASKGKEIALKIQNLRESLQDEPAQDEIEEEAEEIEEE